MQETHVKSPRWRKRGQARNIALAVFFFVLGIIGLLLPIVPQVPFFVMSLLFLSLASRRVHRAVRRFLRRHPKIEASFHSWRHKRRRKRRAKKRVRTGGRGEGGTGR